MSFMIIGILIIIIGAIGSSIGLKDNNQYNLAYISGIIVEFISGTALILYRLNFKQINETSTKLYQTWKYLAAFKKTETLGGDKKNDTIINLIYKFVEEK